MGLEFGTEVYEYSGVSAVSRPLAGAAAAMMFAEGGNAVDAAVATAFALTVVEPQNSGIAGQAFILVRNGASGRIEAIDAYSVAPQAASDDMYEWVPSPTQGDYRFHTVNQANTVGHLAVAIPGSLLGWCDLHQRFARLSLWDALRPAITFARDGFIVDERLAAVLRKHVNKLALFPASRRIWFKDGERPLRAGETVIQTDLARTLEQIADGQADILYRGEVAQALCAQMQRAGGIITRDDLERAHEEILCIRQPIETDFDGWHLYGAPPPTAGGALVSFILRMLELLVSRIDDDFIVALAEVLQFAFSKRAEVFGQCDLRPRDMEQFLSRSYLLESAAEVRKRLDMRISRARPLAAAPQELDNACEETTHHSHLDSAGNCVLCTQSLGDEFGSGVTLPGYGLLLNNAMKLFDPRPNRPNSIAPFRKMLSSMSPTILTKNDGNLLGLGSPSGTRIISAVTQTLVNRLWRGEALADAVARPRIHFSGDRLKAEANLPECDRAALARYGYEVCYLHSWNDWFGAVQAIERTLGENILGAADPRRSGTVIYHEAREAVPSSQ